MKLQIDTREEPIWRDGVVVSVACVEVIEIDGDAPDVLAVLAVLRGARRVEVDDDVCKVDGVPTPGAHQRARLGPCYVSGCHSDATRTDRARGPLCDYHGNW